ncbi:MAG: VWA domain-containing protein [Deinococcus sp.]|nr:VWA domain-containing protein [Deinococcus sp.]
MRRGTILGLLVCTALALAQDSGLAVRITQIDRSRINSGLVDVYFTVRDAQGRGVPNLSQEAVQVLEDGQIREMAGFAGLGVGQRDPINAVLVIDRSSSMSQRRSGSAADSFTAAQEAARAFVRLMQPGDSGALIAFSSTVEVLLPFTADMNQLQRTIDAIPAPRGGTAYFDAAYQGTQLLTGRTGRKVVVLLSDGKSIDDRVATPDQVVALAQNLGVTIFTVGLSEGNVFQDQAALESIAFGTSGQVYYANEPTQLTGVFQQVSQELREEYRITYRTDPGGIRREVNIRLNLGSTQAVSENQASYLAPSVLGTPRFNLVLFLIILLILGLLLLAPPAVGRFRLRLPALLPQAATAPSGATCPKCGALYRPGAKFCNSCGTKRS